jgi:hypothetical protein
MNRVLREWPWVPAAVVLSLGIFWSFQRGAGDFSVFFEAWRLALAGEGMRIYGGTPDRYLYAPGFAWLLAPAAALGRDAALGLWSLGKAILLVAVALSAGGLARAQPEAQVACQGSARRWLPLLGIVVVAKPLLIDFQYGQVNAWLLGGAWFALATHLDPRASAMRVRGAWFVLGVVSAVKLYTLPLFALPLVARGLGVRERFVDRLGAAAIGFGFVFLLPLLFVGVDGWIALHRSWMEALVSRGFPTESHNQSFAAFLQHLFSGEPTHVVALARSESLSVGFPLSSRVIRVLGAFWAACVLVFLLGLCRGGPRTGEGAAWAALLVGLLVMPSHLVWKPYFLMGLPAASLLAARVKGPGAAAALLALAALLNLNGFDFVGYAWAVRLEGGAILLWTHVLLLIWLWRASRTGQPG